MSEPKTKRLLARDLVNWIKEGLLKRERDNQQARQGRRESHGREYFHAREVDGCPLAAYLRRLDFPEESHERFRYCHLAELGNFLEHLVLDAGRASSNQLTISQQRHAKSTRVGGVEVTIVGRSDARLEEDGGVEVKSVSGEEFSELRSRADVTSRRPAHLSQCLTYCYLTESPRWFLLYVDRNDARYRCFDIKRDLKWEKARLQELAQTETCIQTKDPPVPKPSPACYFCPFIKFCPAFGGVPEDPSSKDGLPPSSGEEVRAPSAEICSNSPS